jgi:hypothetical protein
MTLLEECKAALPGDWQPTHNGAEIKWQAESRDHRLRVYESGVLFYCRVDMFNFLLSWSGEGLTVGAAMADCLAKARAAFRCLLPPDPVRAVAESMAGSLTGGEGRHVVEWRTEAGLLRVTVEVEP